MGIQKSSAMLIAALLWVASFSYGVSPGYVETWPAASVEGWNAFDQTGGAPVPHYFGVTNGALTLEPAISEFADTQLWSMVANAGASGGAFFGDYYDSGIYAIECDVSVSVTCKARLELFHSAFPGSFFAQTNLTPGTSHIRIPIDQNTFSPDLFTSESMFEDYLRNVGAIWFSIEWAKDAPNPLFSIDNMVLHGAGEGYGEWADAYEIPFNNRLAHQDADSDGILNGEEYNRDSQPNAVTGPFLIHSDSNAVVWTASSNCMYTVWSSTNLIGGIFEPIDVVNGTNGLMRYDYTENAEESFYRLEVERK